MRSLNVPEDIHKLWLKGGDDRKELSRRLLECGLDKVGSLGCTVSSIHKLGLCWLLEEKFITSVKMLIQQTEGVKYKVKAQWATEDRMRDVLKLRECFS